LSEPFHVICADPPWPFKDRLPGKNRGAAKNYQLLSVRELIRFPLPPIADDAVLFLWRVASMQRAALDVAEAWGFVVKTEGIWLKKTPNGGQWFGMGRTLRAEHEAFLVCTRGNPKVWNHSVRSTFITDFTGLSAPVGRHSEKPERFYEIVESMFEGPRLELFARRQRPGWTCLGNEAGVACR
jgi:N6-adenosine-specific RNA methylase IME4